MSFSVSALSAFILAITPAQVEYAQEVREYSLSVLISCFILLAYAYAVNKACKRNLYYFSFALLVAPLASYGTILMALAALVSFIVIGLFDRNYRRSNLILPVVFLSAGIALTYQLTARYQMGKEKTWYLVNYYPPGEIRDAFKWLARTTIDYFGQGIGGWQTGVIAILVVTAFVINAAIVRCNWQRKYYFCLTLVILVGGSVVAAAIGVYPFGGIRQQLFATPLIVLCTTQSVIWLGALLGKRGTGIVMIGLISVVSLNSLSRLPRVYGEKEDIISAVSEGLKGVPDSNVYVYSGARPAVTFHYPRRNFFEGAYARGDIERIGREIIELNNSCDVSILFSHVFKDEDEKILAVVERSGLSLIEEKKYHGASVAKLSRCADQP